MYSKYEINQSLNELKGKFKIIKNKGWILGEYFGKWNSGITLEKQVGKNQDDFEIPDYNGIELKVISKNKSNYLHLFSAAPDGESFFENKRIWESYGYYEKGKKIFYVEISTNNYTITKNKYHAKLLIDNKKELIYLCLFKNYKLIDKKTYWTFAYLKEKIYRKLNYICIFETIKKKENGKTYYKYINMKTYKLKNFDEFLKAIKNGYIKIRFEISSKKDSYNNIIMHNHGTTFKILKSKIDKIFIKIKKID